MVSPDAVLGGGGGKSALEFMCSRGSTSDATGELATLLRNYHYYDYFLLQYSTKK